MPLSDADLVAAIDELHNLNISLIMPIDGAGGDAIGAAEVLDGAE